MGTADGSTLDGAPHAAREPAATAGPTPPPPAGDRVADAIADAVRCAALRADSSLRIPDVLPADRISAEAGVAGAMRCGVLAAPELLDSGTRAP